MEIPCGGDEQCDTVGYRCILCQRPVTARITILSISGNEVCISNIVDVINDLQHNTLFTYGDCVNVAAPVSWQISQQAKTVFAQVSL
jgi:hypothetical protein